MAFGSRHVKVVPYSTQTITRLCQKCSQLSLSFEQITFRLLNANSSCYKLVFPPFNSRDLKYLFLFTTNFSPFLSLSLSPPPPSSYRCYGNWSGADCSTFICDEEGNKCLNGGTCFPGGINDTQYLCSCPLPYFGSICQYTLKG